MTLYRKAEVVRIHPFAIIQHADQAAATALQGDVNRAGFGIERVFHQLFDHGGGSLHHLARRDPVDENRIKPANMHDISLVLPHSPVFRRL